MINFNQLRVFYQAAKRLNFTAAANELFITQPAVTFQVKAFEEYCDLKLFKKKGRQVYLTDEGKSLFEYAQRVFQFEKEIENAIDEMRKLKRGVLRLGTTKAYARYFMPLMITSFHQKFPDIKIQLVESFPDIKVKLVESFPDNCGEWQVVEAFPDFKVQIVESFPDLKVQYVESFPGMN